MAKLCHTLLFLCCVVSLICSSYAGNLRFSIPPITDIKYENDAHSEGDMLQLTKIQSANSSGWATYNKSIPLWHKPSQALASFSTHFQFVIKPDGYGGDGLAFFMAPFDLDQPERALGRGFGLFNDTTYTGSDYQMVAVEFDTYRNRIDGDGNHVGIDVNSIISRNVTSVTGLNQNYSPCNGSLKSGKQWDAWVDYDGEAKILQVFLSCNPNNTRVSKPPIEMLSSQIDLRNNLPENIRVGFSASTGADIETHTVKAWNFSCEYSWEVLPELPPNNTSDGQINSSVRVILVAVFCSVLTLCVCIFVCWKWRFRKITSPGEEGEESDVKLDEWFTRGFRKFSYAELSAATRNFSEDEKLGQGGFGGVYKGILPGTEEMVAVKRISESSKQGRKEYITEVTIISKLRHRNLVQLLGWCHQKGELLLVYEYLPNGSLDKYIFGEEEDSLDWDRRYSIACDVASALVYLQEEWDQRVVHRDVKASNIMLDSDFNAKLGDFGLARLVERDQAVSHTTVVAGTLGYIPPECYITRTASPEADVYSFGAVTLEIACGRRPVDSTLVEHNCRLVEWVWDLYGQGKLSDAADGKVKGKCNAEEMERLMLVGLLCSHPDPTSRPKMREVLKILKKESEMPRVPLDLPIAVYNYKPKRRDVTSAPSTSSALQSSLVNEMLSSLNASVLS